MQSKQWEGKLRVKTEYYCRRRGWYAHNLGLQPAPIQNALLRFEICKQAKQGIPATSSREHAGHAATGHLRPAQR